MVYGSVVIVAVFRELDLWESSIGSGADVEYAGRVPLTVNRGEGVLEAILDCNIVNEVLPAVRSVVH